MICNFCGEDKKLINAHIINKSLIKEILPVGGKALLVIQTDLHHTPKSWQGEYDTEILCQECDQYLGTIEQIGMQILRNVERHEIVESAQDQSVKCYKLTGIDYISFKLFFLSILWKASLSKRSAYKNVRLGPYQDIIKTMLKNKDYGTDDSFSLCIIKHRPSELLSTEIENNAHRVMLSPAKVLLEDVNYYHFSVLEYDVLIKVTNKPVPKYLLPFSLRKDQPFYIGERDFDSSPKFEFLVRAILEQKKTEDSYKKSRKSLD